MKKLYALLVILIVLYVGINVAEDNIPLVSDNPESDYNSFLHTNDTKEVKENVVSVRASNFSALNNFNDSVVNDTTVSLSDNNGTTIYVSEIDNSESIDYIYNNFIANNENTGTQTIDQKGVTTYLVYNTGSEAYDANIFFNKNGQNYQIFGYGIPLSNSDYFINHCKTIIDTLAINSIS